MSRRLSPIDRVGRVVLGALAAFSLLLLVAPSIIVGAITGESGLDRSVIGTVAAMSIGSMIIYSFGVPWLATSASLEIGVAIEKGVAPFLLGDAIKLALAAAVFPSAWWYVNHGRSDGPR